jgi:flagellar hook protein FlgE
MSFFGVPLSGLIASQSQLQSVANNLSNVDTVGFKDQTMSFSDVFAQNSALNGANDPVQTGLGVLASQTSTDFSDGATTATGVASNMALSGNGFFVVNSSSGAQSYTRAGNFTANASGQLSTPSGELVMGYPAVGGAISTTAALQPLQVGDGAVIASTPTTEFQISGNLDASAAIGTNFSSQVEVFDTLGTSHQLTVSYQKTAANTWSYSVDMPTADTGASTSQLASGTLQFDSSGQLTSPSSSVACSVPSFQDGAAAMKMSWNLTGSNGTASLTQTAVASATTATQDGRASGTLTSYSVSSDGTIEGTYSNGQTGVLGQVAVAMFANTQGLLRTGSNDYQTTPGSGAANIGVAGTGGRGSITGSSVEGSNVDTAAEFAKMIVAQQAYQANAKTVTTLDNISQSTIQMVTN